MRITITGLNISANRFDYVKANYIILNMGTNFVLTITKSLFANNLGTSFKGAGFISVNGLMLGQAITNVSITHSNFTDNWNGVSSLISAFNRAHISFANCIFARNTMVGNGALFLAEYSDTSFEVVDSQLLNNMAR